MASSIFSGSERKPGAKTSTTHGINNSNNNTKTPTNNTKTEMACAAKNMERFLPSVTNFCENSGTKALVKAPSANRLRNKLGNLNATTKASETAPAPKKLANTISRKKPVIRLTNVNPPKAATDLNKDILHLINKYHIALK